MKKVEASIFIRVSPEKALDAFTEPTPLKGWWGVERSLVEKRPGGAYALTWGISEAGFHYVSCGVVKRYEAAKALEISNMFYFNPEKEILGGMGMTVEVSAQDGGTMMRVVQDGYRTGGDWDWYFEAVKTAWPQALQHLKSFLES